MKINSIEELEQRKKNIFASVWLGWCISIARNGGKLTDIEKELLHCANCFEDLYPGEYFQPPANPNAGLGQNAKGRWS